MHKAEEGSLVLGMLRSRAGWLLLALLYVCVCPELLAADTARIVVLSPTINVAKGDPVVLEFRVDNFRAPEMGFVRVLLNGHIAAERLASSSGAYSIGVNCRLIVCL